jgi:drug/metabolite transporter (DMT)-like permease
VAESTAVDASSPADPRRDNLAGILWMLAAVGVLALMDAALKWLAPRYPPIQIAAMRALLSLPIVAVWIALRGGFGQLARVRWSLQLLRGALGVGMLTGFVYSIRALPLAEAYTIFFVSPLFITALSVPLLGERVDSGRWAAILVGFFGVLLVWRPTGAGALSLAGLAAIGSAAAYALAAIVVRVLGRTDSTLSMVFWFLVSLAAGAGALALPGWVPVERADWPVLLVVAITGAGGQFALTEAFRRGEASVVAPFEYSALGWGIALDAAIWATRPSLAMLGGAAIVIGAGLYLVRRERGQSASGTT